MTSPPRDVGCILVVNATTAVTLALHVAAVPTVPDMTENLHIWFDDPGSYDGGSWSPTPDFVADTDIVATVIPADYGGRVHLIDVPAGRYRFAYSAMLPAAPPPPPAEVTWAERLTYLRPSRYCPSDEMFGWANTEFARHSGDRARVEAIVDWVRSHVDYAIDSTSPVGDASGTLMSGRGVCRDFAHLAVTACRALDIPARATAVYAPGLAPMDFHAVFEACLDGAWYVFDPTGLAPRTALTRIATGRDAADNAFMTVIGGLAELLWTQVHAITLDPLPYEDRAALVRLP